MTPDAERITNYKGSKLGIWGPQLVQRLTPDFGSDHDLTVSGFEPHVGLMLSVEPT